MNSWIFELEHWIETVNSSSITIFRDETTDRKNLLQHTTPSPMDNGHDIDLKKSTFLNPQLTISSGPDKTHVAITPNYPGQKRAKYGRT